MQSVKPHALSDPGVLADAMSQGVVILDGAMGTELDSRGVETRHSLWSARALLDAPEQVRAVHADYVAAGARLLTTNTYQATVAGFEEAGYGHASGLEAIREAARLALSVAESSTPELTSGGQPHPGGGLAQVLVAGGVGPFGAYLADGSEYDGAYPQSLLAADPRFDEVHRLRIRALMEEGIGIFALETLPRLDEARAVVEILRTEAPWARCYVSFQARAHQASLADGTPLTRAAAWAQETPEVLAVGVNCVAPAAVEPALEALGEGTTKPLVAYPNSGEVWDAQSKTWHAAPADDDPVALAPTWVSAGARLVGGCCRTSPDLIARLSETLAA